MWSPFADRPPRSVAPAATSSGHQSARFGGTWMPTSGISSRATAISRFMSVDATTGLAHAGAGTSRPPVQPRAPVRLRRRRRDLAPAPRRSSGGAGRSSAGSPPAGGRARRAPPPAPPAPRRGPASVSPIPTRIPLVNGIRSSPAARIVSQPQRRVLRRRALVRDEVVARGLEHQPLRGRHLAQPREVLARERAEVRVRQQPALQRPLAAPHDVGDEVREAQLRRAAPARPGWCAGSSPVSTSSSFTPRRAAPSISASTSSGACRCGRCVANAQYLQCETHVRDSDSVTLRENVTRRRIPPQSRARPTAPPLLRREARQTRNASRRSIGPRGPGRTRSAASTLGTR